MNPSAIGAVSFTIAARAGLAASRSPGGRYVVGDYQHIDAGSPVGAFERLQTGARRALELRECRALVDMRQVDPVDGAMLAVLARMAQSLGPSARVALVVSAETLKFLTEWRLDSLWLLHTEPDQAVTSLLR